MIVVAIIMAALLISVVGAIGHRQTTARLGEIHTLVNSNLTKVQADLKIALERIELLEQHLAKAKPEDTALPS
jgi:hypothetical protein